MTSVDGNANSISKANVSVDSDSAVSTLNTTVPRMITTPDFVPTLKAPDLCLVDPFLGFQIRWLLTHDHL